MSQFYFLGYQPVAKIFFKVIFGLVLKTILQFQIPGRQYNASLTVTLTLILTQLHIL